MGWMVDNGWMMENRINEEWILDGWMDGWMVHNVQIFNLVFSCITKFMSHFIVFVWLIMITMSKILYTLVVFLKSEKKLICKNKIKNKNKNCVLTNFNFFFTTLESTY